MLKNKNVFHQQTNTKQRRSPLKDTPKKKERERETDRRKNKQNFK